MGKAGGHLQRGTAYSRKTEVNFNIQFHIKVNHIGKLIVYKFVIVLFFRFQFPAQWLHVDNIEGEWSAFNEIMRRKDSSIQTQVRTFNNILVYINKVVININFQYVFRSHLSNKKL